MGFNRANCLRCTIAFCLLVVLSSGCAVSRSSYEASYRGSLRAISDGRVEEALRTFEAEAVEAEQNAASSWFPQRYRENASKAYSKASRLARASGQLQKSLAYAQKGLQNADSAKSPGYQVYAIVLLIDAHRDIRDFEKANALTAQGFRILKEMPSSDFWRVHWQSTMDYYSGLEFIRQQQFQQAIDSFSSALESNENMLASLLRFTPAQKNFIDEQKTLFVVKLNWLGNAYLAAGDLTQAFGKYEKALRFVQEWALQYAYEPGLYISIAEIKRREKKFSEAMTLLQDALVIAERQNVPALITDINRRIGYLFLYHLGKPIEAIPYYARAIRLIESTRSLLASEAFRRSFFEGGLGAYESIMRALNRSDQREAAFEYSEKAKSRAFLDVLGSRVELSKLKSGLLEQERALQERIAAIKARTIGQSFDPTVKTGLQRELADAEKAYNGFLEKVRKENKEQASLMTVEPLTIKQVQELLDPGTTLIEYYVTQSEIFVWVVEGNKLVYERIEIPRAKLSAQITTLRESIFALGEKQKLDETSAALYKQLIEPLLSHISGKELIVVPHDVLHYLPFQALLSPQRKYLIQDYPIYYLSSASLLQFVKEKRRAQGEKVLALGNPDLGDPKMSLQFAEVEAKEIRGLYPQSTVLLNKEATEEKAKTLSPGNDIIHFASHAELNENDPLASAILLAKSDKEDGRLEVREIFGMDLKASLVVLSACETGLGKLSSGDELVGLTRAFIYAGTPSVVASLWNVEDSSTAQLMASFYKNLKTMSKVEALRQAQLNLIRGNVNSDLLARRGIGGVGKLGETPASKSPSQDSVSVSTSHPYFWAPFILVGDGK